MNAMGAVYPPDLIELMKNVLDDTAAMIPEAKRTSAAKAEIASCILACAAQGERDAKALRAAALLAVVDGRIFRATGSSERRSNVPAISPAVDIAQK